MNWQVEVTPAARRDFGAILDWTTVQFGTGQAVRYEKALLDLIEAAANGPSDPALRRRPSLGPDYYTAHMRRRGRHVLLLRVMDREHRSLVLLRNLHDRMDVRRALD
jgi:plasmid stabilization system protein ParE